MAEVKVDPFKFIGEPSEWGVFGNGEHDMRCDAERRALCDYFIRRIMRSAKRGESDNPAADLLTGGVVAFAGLFISVGGGPEAMTEENFERWIGAVTFGWYQALSAGSNGSAVQ